MSSTTDTYYLQMFKLILNYLYNCDLKLTRKVSKKILTLSAFLLGLMPLLVQAQDPHFSQYYANPLYLNPALAGVSKCPRLSMNYRNQYPVYGVYQTYSASYDQYVDEMNGGLGLLILRDEAGNGALTATEVSGVYSYHLKASRKFSILAGFQATLRQRSVDFGSLTFPDQIDPFYGFVNQTNEVVPGGGDNVTNTHFDVSTGIVGFTERFYIGLAVHHLTQPNEAFFVNSQLPMKITAHTGFTIPLGRKRLHNSDQNLLIPNIVYQNQGSFNQLTTSVAFNRAEISGGAGFRFSTSNPDAVVIMLGYAPEEAAWRIGYSYDVTISTQANDSGGAHEISLAYQFKCRKRRKRLKAIKCPKF